MASKDSKPLRGVTCIVMLGLFSTGNARATLVNSNSIVEYGIEYYVQTDKPTYTLGENVEMLFRVTNLTDDPVTIYCTKYPELNLSVVDGAETVWMKVGFWYLYSPGVPLSPGESTEISHTWDMKDKTHNLLTPGNYDVVGIMYNGPWREYNNHENYFPTEVGVSIAIIPEPSSALLFAGAAFILMYKRGRN
jgi:hypothetical protein